MPITKSAIKRARQDEKRRIRRRPFSTHMKTMISKIIALAKEGKKSEAEKLLPLVFKSIDTAAKKHLIHPKNAAHKKSAVSKLLRASAKK
ncbi:MAG: 30S ribosomal protein S20 [Candidatus Peribacteraceae bacterium]|nr:30S ribosomal protein S20 [Candidatus Peribacteraceae bacterium]